MADQSINSRLLKGKELSDSDIAVLRDDLLVRKIDDLRKIASIVSVRPTGSTRKKDIMDRIIGMAQIGALHDSSGEDNGEDVIAISYLTEEVKSFLKSLPSFSSVMHWSKRLRGVLAEFSLINIVIYLVYGRDKTFDMQALRAHKSMKAYKYFFDGYVKNVWVFQCSSEKQLNLRVLYFRGFVYHSFTTDTPYEVFVSLNGDNGDVYAGQCACVSG